MALVGVGPAPFFNYGHNHWSALFATPPSSLVTAGVLLPDGSRFVVEVAKVTPSTIGGTATWFDITTRVNRLSFLHGDPSGAVSRWPIEVLTITTADLTDLLGDFVENVATSASSGPAPGMFARWGIINGGVWQPMQSCVVETIDDMTSGRVRGWRIQAFGTLLYFAGFEWYDFAGTAAGTNLNTYMAFICSTFQDFVNAPWPWAESFATQNGSFASTLGANITSPPTYPKLQFLNQLADSQGMRIYNTPTGGLATELWTATVPTTFRVSDETRVAVDGHGFVPGTIGGRFQWARSQSRTFAALFIPGQGWGANDMMYTKWFHRSDVRGFPITDGRSIPTFAQANALIAATLPLFARETRLDRVTVDTVEDAAVWPLLTAVQPLWPRSTFTIERRRPGTSWLEASCYVHAISGTVEFASAVGHFTADYYTRLI